MDHPELVTVIGGSGFVGTQLVQELARAGRLLRLLHAVQWELRSFRHAWIERALRNMRSYEKHLRETVGEGAWLSR